jgi:hypothetical protein
VVEAQEAKEPPTLLVEEYGPPSNSSPLVVEMRLSVPAGGRKLTALLRVLLAA